MITTKHRWICAKCYNANNPHWKVTLEIDPNSPLDKIMLNNIEQKISIHVIKTGHIVTHDSRDEVKVKGVSKDGFM